MISCFFTISAKDRPPPHPLVVTDVVTTVGAEGVPTVMLFSDSGLEDEIDFSSELASSVVAVPELLVDAELIPGSLF